MYCLAASSNSAGAHLPLVSLQSAIACRLVLIGRVWIFLVVAELLADAWQPLYSAIIMRTVPIDPGTQLMRPALGL